MPNVDSYDLIVIGAGQGGGPLAGTVAEAGHDVALLERTHVGGTCVNEGCTPTKTMIASARVAHLARRAEDYGVETGEVTVDLETVRQRKRDIVESFRAGSRSSVEAKSSLDLIEGDGRFVDAETVAVDLNDGGRRTLTADRIVINTGTRPAVPPIDGLDEVDFLTSTSIMELGAVPDHLLVLGGGYIGLEFGQMFRRFGAEVTIIDRGEHVLSREDTGVAEALEGILREDGLRLLNETSVTAVEETGDAITAHLGGPDAPAQVEGDELLVAAGRRPNTDTLNLEAAGVAATDRGHVRVDDRLATTADGVYAIGDVTGGPAFTHVSYDDYRVLQDNWLHDGDRTTEDRLISYTLFTDPQLGRVGLTEEQARAQDLDVTVAQMPMTRVARALEVDETRGLMKAVIDAETNRLLGAAVLGIEGGEVMSVLQTAMMGDLPVGRLRAAPFAHPTLAESLNNLFAGLDLGPSGGRPRSEEPERAT
ncbi:mercuric reductase [Salinibacter ruber]|uniref:mercuric reductase n=1 Tax=Salinibacter ruber TaxID=146919 RepID=UPI00216916CD|nr:mercuric reductase [Salinibacter ruber]MCS3698330.1 pyruvate/2-oxoglutarate dehydrogenase complex dihydrolipoamide dehydrogenase (E3) component [Salinibacter ruber]